MNPIYRDLVLSRIQTAINTAHAASGLSHKVLKGLVREILIRDMLRPFLPTDFGIGTGLIISSSGDVQSRQQDIIIYDRRALVPILFEEGSGISPVESVIHVIEVKSRLNLKELRTSHASAKHLASFQYVAAIEKPIQIQKAISNVFAFNTALEAV